MSQPAGAPTRIEAEAIEWLLAMNGRTVSQAEQSRFAAWLEADPEHRRIFDCQQEAWGLMRQMPHLLHEALAARVPEHRRRVFDVRMAALAASLIVALAGTWLYATRTSWGTRPTSFATTTGQLEEIRLADGTRVTLGAASRMDVAFDKVSRRVTLARGEAYFDVSTDVQRPFLVTAGATLVRVIGTKFDVNYRAESVRVAVEEGRVEVMKTDGSAQPQNAHSHLLLPGDSALSERSGQIAATTRLNKADLGAWRRGHFVYIDAPLRDVIADINRYYDGEIELADQETANLRLTSTFRADQIDRMIQVLERALPITAVATSHHHIVLSQRTSQH